MEEWNPTSKDSSQLFETGMEIQKNSYMRFSVWEGEYFGIFFHLKNNKSIHGAEVHPFCLIFVQSMNPSKVLPVKIDMT